jgi:molybdate transport system substrate-binding protein
VLLLSALLAGCGAGGPAPPSGQLTIFASPSLTDVMGELVDAFTGTYPAVRIVTVFEPDSALAQRAAAGPMPDLIAAEDPATLLAAGATGTPVRFAQGQLVLAVRAGAPPAAGGLADLARPGLRVAVCDPVEPCGRVASAVLAAAQVDLGGNALLEPDVRSALRHVTDGTADAALVYRSDARVVETTVLTIEVATSATALAQFVAVVPAGAGNPVVARTFLDYLASPDVAGALTRRGFRAPD